MSPSRPVRGLFDPDPDEPSGHGTPASPPAPSGSRENPYSVSALNALARGLVEDAFPSVWITGEVSNFLAHRSGHWYFTLKDGGAELNAAMFARENRGVKFEPRDGLEVLSRGKLTIYPSRGRYQVVVEEMRPRKEGALQLAFRQLESKLRQEGLFDEERKRPIPMLPLRIGVVTSRDGAAFRDILRVLHDRFAGVSVLLRDARVQGEGAAAEIARAIGELNEYGEHGHIDVLIVGRGGGSLEDLWAFNEEPVVRAVAASAIPVISAVGHEVDVTLCDLAADLRAATPSAAAENVIASSREITGQLARLTTALTSRARLIVETRRLACERLTRSRGMAATETRVREERQRVDEMLLRASHSIGRLRAAMGERLARLTGRLSPRSLLESTGRRRDTAQDLTRRMVRSGRSRLAAAGEEISRLAGLLDACSPLSVLDRGYSICFDASGKSILRDASVVSTGDAVIVRLRQGRLDCSVTAARASEEAKLPGPAGNATGETSDDDPGEKR